MEGISVEQGVNVEQLKGYLDKEERKIQEDLISVEQSLRLNAKTQDRASIGEHADCDSSRHSDMAVLSERKKSLLKLREAIECARERIKDGKGGICVKCGEPIGERRLKAMPHTSQCFNCKNDNHKDVIKCPSFTWH